MPGPQSLSDDVAYLIDLAEQGRAAPPLGGRFALWWGVLTTLVLIGHWLVITGRAASPEILPLLWLGYGAIGSVGTFVLNRTVCAAPGAAAVNNRVAGIVWGMMGLMTGLYAVGVFFGVWQGEAPLATFDTILGVAFAGYAIAFFVTGRLSADSVSLGFATISALGVVLIGVLVGQPVVYLVAALFAAVTSIGSGLYQMAREPKTTV